MQNNTPDLLLCRCHKLASGACCVHICSCFASNMVLGLYDLHENNSEQVLGRSNKRGPNSSISLFALFARNCGMMTLTYSAHDGLLSSIADTLKMAYGSVTAIGNASSYKLCSSSLLCTLRKGHRTARNKVAGSVLTVAVLEMASIERAQASTFVQSFRLSWRLLYTEDAASGGTTLIQKPFLCQTPT